MQCVCEVVVVAEGPLEWMERTSAAKGFEKLRENLQYLKEKVNGEVYWSR